MNSPSWGIYHLQFFFFFFHALFDSTGNNNHHLMETMLIEGGVSLLLHGVVNLFPLVQVLMLNQVNLLNSSTVRFHIFISDALHKHETLLPIIYNCSVEKGQLKEGSIIKITQCTCNVVHNVTSISFPHSFFPLNEFHSVDVSNVLVSHYFLAYFFLPGLSHWLHLKLSQWMQRLLGTLHLTTSL